MVKRATFPLHCDCSVCLLACFKYTYRDLHGLAEIVGGSKTWRRGMHMSLTHTENGYVLDVMDVTGVCACFIGPLHVQLLACE